MAQWSLNTSALWRRLGLREAGGPDLVNAVQPTYLVGDGSGLVPPVLPPIAWFGGEESNAVSTHSLDVKALAPGGCFVRHFRCHNNITQGNRWGIIETDAVITGVTLPAQNMGPVPVVSLVQLGTVAAPTVPLLSPTQRVTANVASVIDDLIYVPPGQHFRWEALGASANTSRIGLVVQDVPEAIPASPL